MVYSQTGFQKGRVEKMNYQWYPGHMTKAKRAMLEDIKLVDLVIELVDARIPLSSKNPDIDSLARGKARILLLNKADLADDEKSRLWMKYYEDQGIHAALVNSSSSGTLRRIRPLIDQACAEKTERDRKRGILNRPVRAMICGIPNVGKSTFINSFAGRAAAKTGNRPGVTKGKQWISLNKKVELLDTPGILWPKFEDPHVGEKLAMTGAIRDEILPGTDLAGKLILLLEQLYPDALRNRYFRLPGTEGEEPDVSGKTNGPAYAGAVPDGMLAGSEHDRHTGEILEAIARSRGCIRSDGASDPDRAAALLIDDFRKAKLGKITLEIPPDTIYY